MPTSNFDRIAVLYDTLARIAFGNAIVRAQHAFLYVIPEDARILILGGGTGAILPVLFAKAPRCEVWYIDASAKMIELAHKRMPANDIHFFHGTEESMPARKDFDVVITFFYLDLFSTSELPSVIHKLKSALKPNALWLAADFISEKKWQRIVLKFMYLFFNITCGLKTKTLPDWSQALTKAHLEMKSSKSFCVDFIKSGVYSNSH